MDRAGDEAHESALAGMDFETAERDLQMMAFASIKRVGLEAVVLISASKSPGPGPRAVPKLAWMMLAGSGIELKEKFASAWNWKSVPFTPLIVPILGMTFGAAATGTAGKER